MKVNFLEAFHSIDGRRLFGNFIYLSVLRGFQFLIPLLTLPYLIRTVGVSNYGLISFAMSLGLYFGALIQFGFGISATREIARIKEDHAKLESVYSSTLIASVLLALVSIFLFSLIMIAFENLKTEVRLYSGTMAYVVFNSLFPIWFFQGTEKMKYITIFSVATGLIYLISLVCLVKNESDYFLVPFLYAIAALMTLCASLLFIRKEFCIKIKLSSWKQVKNTLDTGRNAFFSQLAPNLYNNSTTFLLGIHFNTTTVGIFSAAGKIIDAVASIAQILSKTFLPFFSRTLNNHKLFCKFMIGVGVTLTTIVFIFAENIVELLFGPKIPETALYLKTMSLSIIFIFMINAFGVNFLMLIGKDSLVKDIVIYSSIAVFFLGIFIIPTHGIMGAVYIVTLGRASIGILEFCFYIKLRNSVNQS